MLKLDAKMLKIFQWEINYHTEDILCILLLALLHKYNNGHDIKDDCGQTFGDEHNKLRDTLWNTTAGSRKLLLDEDNSTVGDISGHSVFVVTVYLNMRTEVCLISVT